MNRNVKISLNLIFVVKIFEFKTTYDLNHINWYNSNQTIKNETSKKYSNIILDTKKWECLSAATKDCHTQLSNTIATVLMMTPHSTIALALYGWDAHPLLGAVWLVDKIIFVDTCASRCVRLCASIVQVWVMMLDASICILLCKRKCVIWILTLPRRPESLK